MIPGLGRFPGEEKGYPLQYSGLESDTTEQLSLSLYLILIFLCLINVNLLKASIFCINTLIMNIQKTKIVASNPITSRQIDGETMETVTDFIFLGSKITGW